MAVFIVTVADEASGAQRRLKIEADGIEAAGETAKAHAPGCRVVNVAHAPPNAPRAADVAPAGGAAVSRFHTDPVRTIARGVFLGLFYWAGFIVLIYAVLAAAFIALGF